MIEGNSATRFFADPDGTFRAHAEAVPYAIKVETHNHPTAISPYPGAATGSGGEIRDEGATGRGGKPKAGLVGFTVSDLRIPGLARPWETARPLPPRFASAFEIMRDGRSAAPRSTTNSADRVSAAISARSSRLARRPACVTATTNRS